MSKNVSLESSGSHEPWLFSRGVDLAVFLGSAGLSLAALAVGWITGVLHQETPSWAWVPAVILCDVAHVWSTVFRTYLDPAERRARRTLLTVVPLVGFGLGALLFSFGELTFWRCLAYLAMFHFVRQQAGWVALYRARSGETSKATYVIDTWTIYAATLWPLFFWHTHAPRRFDWFFPGDVVVLLPFLMPLATVVYVCGLGVYAVRAVALWRRGTPATGKNVVVGTTALAWLVGIVVFDSDYAFTVTNVFMHGIPYLALVYVHTRKKLHGAQTSRAATRDSKMRRPSLSEHLTRYLGTYLAFLWLLAFLEEWLWDKAVWHERLWLFGDSWALPQTAKRFIVPFLALPQLTHYVLDGVLWRRRSNPTVAELMAPRDAVGS